MEKKTKKNQINTFEDNILYVVEKKISFFKDVMQRIIIHIEKNKMLDILSIGDISNCIEKLNLLDKQLFDLEVACTLNNTNEFITSQLQTINNGLASVIKNYGTINLEDLLNVCLGENKIVLNGQKQNIKFELLKNYFHPTGYSILNTKNKHDLMEDINSNSNNNTNNNFNNEQIKNTEYLECFDIDISVKQYHMKIYGIKIHIYSSILKKGLIINGILDNIIIDLLNDTKHLLGKQCDLIKKLPSQPEFNEEIFKSFLSSLTLKDYLINDDFNDIYNKFAGYCSQYNTLKKKHISSIVSEFIKSDMYIKYNTLKILLIYSQNSENMYLAYLLYDLLSNETNGEIDTQDQVILFDSFPWYIKQKFKHAMKKTIQYTSDLSNFDINKIPLEQRICLLNTDESVKEKAMIKLKEVKAKSEDSGTKARQYLDGLLKIPFNVIKKEPIMEEMTLIRNKFKYILNSYDLLKDMIDIQNKEKYSIMEIMNIIYKIKEAINKKETDYIDATVNKITQNVISGNKSILLNNINTINFILNKNQLYENIILHSTNPKKDELTKKINNLMNDLKNDKNNANNKILNDLMNAFIKSNEQNEDHLENKKNEVNDQDIENKKKIHNKSIYSNIKKDINLLEEKIRTITDYTNSIKKTLDTVVHGHNNAKKQVERVIGQWINSSGNSDESHVLGFEGNPGIGKTTLAKGLAKCLLDENGNSRPFSLIAIGGDSNSSSLVGHSYTYVGSTWGQIVQILMDQKCMNPIILIDELDKISKTEHGKEISGVLTHMLDPSQNKNFQDKYFSGIDIDLSKVLFIVSYNDSQSIDRIMLDRIHRIKFDSLTMEDKVSICNKHLLPELYKKIGLEDTIFFPDEVLKFIIEEYTLEPGVRKLKEKLFEIVGEINLNILKGDIKNIELPIEITIENIKNNYFKDKRENKNQKIHSQSEIGVINALWANEMAQGGILPLQVSFIPSNKFLDLTLTGSLGDVMKESISVSLTNAWNLTSFEIQQKIIEKYNNPSKNQVYGLHVHCPSISTKKDGPSATTAFTVIIYSLFNSIKIKNYFGITGETSFDYCLTEIGGLREKIIHSIPAGVKEFIYPYENQKDFERIMEKYKDKDIIKGIKFHPVHTIHEVFDLILEK